MNFIAFKHYTAAAAAAAFITKKSTMAEEWRIIQNPKGQSWLNQQPGQSLQQLIISSMLSSCTLLIRTDGKSQRMHILGGD